MNAASIEAWCYDVQVLGTPDRKNVDDLTLEGLTEVLMHKDSHDK